jgi:hypothetical protein
MIVEMKNSNSIKLLTREHDKSIVIENTQPPLKREWEYVTGILNDKSSRSIYPSPSSVFQCMKWLEEIKNKMSIISVDN